MDLDAVSILILQQQPIIKSLGPVMAKEPVPVVTLPGDVERAAVADYCISGSISHDAKTSRNRAKFIGEGAAKNSLNINVLYYEILLLD